MTMVQYGTPAGAQFRPVSAERLEPNHGRIDMYVPVSDSDHRHSAAQRDELMLDQIALFLLLVRCIYIYCFWSAPCDRVDLPGPRAGLAVSFADTFQASLFMWDSFNYLSISVTVRIVTIYLRYDPNLHPSPTWSSFSSPHASAPLIKTLRRRDPEKEVAREREREREREKMAAEAEAAAAVLQRQHESRIGCFLYYLKCHPFSPASYSFAKNRAEEEDDSTVVEHEADHPLKRKPGGWKSMPYIIGNETFEKLATIGLLSNFMVYLLTQYHMNQVDATNVVNIWSGTTNFAPLLGAFVSDAYLGRFRTLAYSSVASFLGMVTLTLTAMIPSLRPPSCNPAREPCEGPDSSQLGVLYLALGMLTFGAAGIRPCSLPFGVDQFDPTTEKGRKGIDSFFNWYYFTFTVAIMIALTVIVYIQSNVSWALGLGIPTLLMIFSITLFFLGTRVYIHVPPSGSVFSDMAQVLAAAYRKRRLDLPTFEEQERILYNPPPKQSYTTKLPLTPHMSCLNKAALVVEGDLDQEGSPSNPWRLCSIQQIEELKCLIRIVPIWAAGIICFTAIAQQNTFTVSQAMKMDRHLGPHFQIPPGSLGVISMIALTLWIPFYDRALVPAVQKLTKKQGGITLLQRMGIGMGLSILSMVVAGLVEAKRRDSAVARDGVAPISVMWLAPQLVLMGLCEAFNGIGQIEFYYKQFPEHMRSFAGSLFFCTMAGASYMSSFIIAVVHRHTGTRTKQNWLADDINQGRLDYFYYLVAGLGVVNLLYFIACARCYRYKPSSLLDGGHEDRVINVDIELNESSKPSHH
ncbi:hypothetical protein H6P81_000248 [Aristolochia fimbriata]|uniref:Uncharacterized protein n=1 Tax=Aristolochia fimbriata TaxID=158543 RepID=A0AAV7F611_ARIFI|nr:hypothetical protein H6P81_000248 [Aristolochia fimbriata]